MTHARDIFEHVVAIDPAGDLEATLKLVPGRWAVYLMADAADRPVQLLCVRNLKQSLRRRLGEGEQQGPSRKIDYATVVRRVHWRRVDSAFEADWAYLEASRRLFPQTYRGLLGFEPAWFIHVDPDAAFPRYVKTTELARDRGMLVGPIADKHAAARLIELLEDAFDLCRYHNVLTAAPNGRACAYKQMHKCPAPCDGSIAMEQYRRMVQWSIEAVTNPAAIVGEHRRRMAQAAADMRFEAAGRIKAYVDQLAKLGTGGFRHARPLDDFRYISIQRGPTTATAKVFVITPGAIELALGLRLPLRPTTWTDVASGVFASANRTPALDAQGIERIGLVAHHLLARKASGGSFVPLSEFDERSLEQAIRQLARQEPDEPGDEQSEGVQREMRAM